LISEMDRQT